METLIQKVVQTVLILLLSFYTIYGTLEDSVSQTNHTLYHRSDIFTTEVVWFGGIIKNGDYFG